jgi:hypothetical protein
MKKLLLLVVLLSLGTRLSSEVIQTFQDSKAYDHSLTIVRATRSLLDISWQFKLPRVNQAEANQLLKHVEKLLAQGANPNACIETGVIFECCPPIWETETLVQRAIPYYPEILECLFKAGASVYSGGHKGDEGRAFYTALANNNVDAVEIFLKYGINPNYKRPFSSTVLAFALSCGSKEAADLLIKHGATE